MPSARDQTGEERDERNSVSSLSRLPIGSLVPPAVALLLDLTLFRSVSVWLLFQPAIIVSAWIGGLTSAILSSIASAIFVWCFVLIKFNRFDPGDPRNWITTAAFIISGIVIGALFDRLRRARAVMQRQKELVEATNVRLQKAVDRLIAGRRVFQSVIDNSPGMIVIKDVEGKLVLFNRGFEKAAGRTYDQLVGKRVYEFFPPEVAARREATDVAVLGNRETVTLEETVKLADGDHVFLASTFPLTDHKGELIGVCWMETDITERKRAEEEVRLAAHYLAEAQRVGRLGSWFWDIRSDAVTWSDEMFRLHGRDRETRAPSITDMPALFTLESGISLTAALESVRSQGTSYEIELQTNETNGQVRWIVDRGEAVRHGDGQIIGVRGISQDITRVKELQQLREEWIAVIGHDLREPIGSIRMATQLLPELHRGTMDERETVMTERIGKAAASLERMVVDLLDVSKLETARLSLKRTWIEPKRVIREALEGMAHVTRNNRVLIREDAAPERVFADEGRVRQVMTNLISNAVKYGRKDGGILILLRGRGNELEVAVSNHGTGIAAADLGNLFTRFGRLEEARRSGVQGLGLGLYLAKGLVEAHGGRIWCESAPNKATSFHFTIPMERLKEAAA